MSEASIDVAVELEVIRDQLVRGDYLTYQQGVTRLEALIQTLPVGHSDRHIVSRFIDRLGFDYPAPRYHGDGTAVRQRFRQLA